MTRVNKNNTFEWHKWGRRNNRIEHNKRKTKVQWNWDIKVIQHPNRIIRISVYLLFQSNYNLFKVNDNSIEFSWFSIRETSVRSLKTQQLQKIPVEILSAWHWKRKKQKLNRHKKKQTVLHLIWFKLCWKIDKSNRQVNILFPRENLRRTHWLRAIVLLLLFDLLIIWSVLKTFQRRIYTNEAVCIDFWAHQCHSLFCATFLLLQIVSRKFQIEPLWHQMNRR